MARIEQIVPVGGGMGLVLDVPPNESGHAIILTREELDAGEPPSDLTERERLLWQLGYNMGREQEREACATICDEFDAINDDGYPVRPEGTVQGAETIARVIRARR